MARPNIKVSSPGPSHRRFSSPTPPHGDSRGCLIWMGDWIVWIDHDLSSYYIMLYCISMCRLFAHQPIETIYLCIYAQIQNRQSPIFWFPAIKKKALFKARARKRGHDPPTNGWREHRTATNLVRYCRLCMCIWGFLRDNYSGINGDIMMNNRNIVVNNVHMRVS